MRGFMSKDFCGILAHNPGRVAIDRSEEDRSEKMNVKYTNH